MTGPAYVIRRTYRTPGGNVAVQARAAGGRWLTVTVSYGRSTADGIARAIDDAIGRLPPLPNRTGGDRGQ